MATECYAPCDDMCDVCVVVVDILYVSCWMLIVFLMCHFHLTSIARVHEFLEKQLYMEALIHFYVLVPTFVSYFLTFLPIPSSSAGCRRGGGRHGGSRSLQVVRRGHRPAAHCWRGAAPQPVLCVWCGLYPGPSGHPFPEAGHASHPAHRGKHPDRLVCLRHAAGIKATLSLSKGNPETYWV